MLSLNATRCAVRVREATSQASLAHLCYCGKPLVVSFWRGSDAGLQHCSALRRGCSVFMRCVGGPASRCALPAAAVPADDTAEQPHQPAPALPQEVLVAPDLQLVKAEPNVAAVGESVAENVKVDEASDVPIKVEIKPEVDTAGDPEGDVMVKVPFDFPLFGGGVPPHTPSP